MAVSEIKLLGEGASGRAEGTSGGEYRVSYSATYQVTCDSQADAPSTVLEYFRTHPTYPWIGRTYKFGGGFDTAAVCRSINASYIQGSGGMFLVPVEFQDAEIEDQQQQPNQAGQLTADPLEWMPEIEVSYGNYSRPVEHATFVKANNAAGVSDFLKSGKLLPVTNSALQPLNPSFEEEYSYKIIRFTTNVTEYDDEFWNTYHDSINAAKLTINLRKLKFKTSIPKHWAKLRVGAALNFSNKKLYWRRTLELQIKDWDREIADKGTVEIFKQGDFLPDQTEVQQADIPTGRKTIERTPKDIEDVGVSDEFPLDGKGKRLREGETPVTLVWRSLNEADFSKINWV